ncbi:2,5-diamino-6-(ribosylamino)-4(3H)-pyrimidinone 5'-phosphate reductase [Halosegnis marinus]|uniref:2,5-diamino-6-(ribosylamino)-4(3H)-pyrimidinone 5'-phosphate reductase n=1 Tax=Halosegnis marinus TaxID=3034023 RepID=A0ABD5ZKV8_9EURY|nr:2,5-diamino-6-(ribosylamino)-4(3H)-pyrimidinone 5'-phosphate reductase [Halosegnis sp. DT85]
MHVHVNAAASADGKLSTRRREQVRISGEADFARMERIRAESDAVLVGVGTVLADDPSLLRHDEARRAELGKAGRPARVVADSRARTPADAAILDGPAATYLLVSEAAPADRVRALEDAGATVIGAGGERVALPAALSALADAGVEYLMVEGGGELIFSLFAEGLVDELTLYVGSLILGGRDAPTLADGEGFVGEFPRPSLVGVERMDDGVVLSYEV